MGLRVRIQATEGGQVALADAELPRDLLRAGARAALRSHQVREGELSLTLLDDQEIAALNQQYLEHEGATDVISFALFEPPEPVLGDVYLGVAQAARQARSRRIPLEQELLRLTVHGTLHVLGYDHPTDDSRTTSEMWRLQEQLVQEIWHG